MLSLLLGLLGTVAVLVGVALIYPPLALILGGAALVRIAVFLDRPKEAR